MTNDPTRGDEAEAQRHELTVVMPVHNEADGLAACLTAWRCELDRLGVDHRILVLDDGSTDATPAVLAGLADDRHIDAVSKANEGHGPTVLRGYAAAVADSEWVFQVDSDDEIPADAFEVVWSARSGHDAVFGYRTGRDQPLDRRVISRVAGLVVRGLFGSCVRDVNVPYRLVRSEVLAPLLDAIPADTFAPNLVVSGVLGRDPSTFAEVPVPHTQRRTGQVSFAGIGALRAAARSFAQTLHLAWRLRGATPPHTAGE